MGMAGKGDEAGRGGPEGADASGLVWAAAVMAAMRALVDKAVAAAEAVEIRKGDVLEAGRVARAAGNIARAVRSIQAAQPRVRGRPSQTQDPEEHMDAAIEYDPERVAAMREELWSRCVELRDIIERKGRAEDAGGPGAGGLAQGGAEAGGREPSPTA